MRANTGERIIHGYDTTTRRVLCGISQQASSTKHFGSVTCTSCRELMQTSPVAAEPGAAIGPQGG